MSSNLYDLLGASPSCSPDELRRAYKKKALATHPDKHPDDPNAAAKFREIHKAWLVLSDERQRAAYDTRRQRSSSSSASTSRAAQNQQPGRAANRGTDRWDNASNCATAASSSDDDEIWEGGWDDLRGFADEMFYSNIPSWDDLWEEEDDAPQQQQRAQATSAYERALLRGAFTGIAAALLALYGLRWIAADVPLFFPSALTLSNRRFGSMVSLQADFRAFTSYLLSEHAASHPISRLLSTVPSLAMAKRVSLFRLHRPYLKLLYNASDGLIISNHLSRSIPSLQRNAILLSSQRRVNAKLFTLYTFVQPADAQDGGPAKWPPPHDPSLLPHAGRELCVRLLKSGTIERRAWFSELSQVLDGPPGMKVDKTQPADWRGARGRLRPFGLVAVRSGECNERAGVGMPAVGLSVAAGFLVAYLLRGARRRAGHEHHA